MSSLRASSFAAVYDEYAAQIAALRDPDADHEHPITEKVRTSTIFSAEASPAYLLMLQHVSQRLHRTPYAQQPKTMAEWADWMCSEEMSTLWRAQAWDNPTLPVAWWLRLCTAAEIFPESDYRQKHVQMLRIFESVHNDQHIPDGTDSIWLGLGVLLGSAKEPEATEDLVQRFAQTFPLEVKDMLAFTRIGFMLSSSEQGVLKKHLRYANDEVKRKYLERSYNGNSTASPRLPIYSLHTYTTQVHPLSWGVGPHNLQAIRQMFSSTELTPEQWPHVMGMLHALDHYQPHNVARLDYPLFEQTMTHIQFATLAQLGIYNTLMDKDRPWMEQLQWLRNLQADRASQYGLTGSVDLSI